MNLMRPFFLLILFLSAALPAAGAESKFTIEPVGGKVTASWKGTADTSGIDLAPTDDEIAALGAVNFLATDSQLGTDSDRRIVTCTLPASTLAIFANSLEKQSPQPSFASTLALITRWSMALRSGLSTAAIGLIVLFGDPVSCLPKSRVRPPSSGSLDPRPTVPNDWHWHGPSDHNQCEGVDDLGPRATFVGCTFWFRPDC